MVVPFYNPTVHKCSLFSTPKPAFISCLLDDGLSKRHEELSHHIFFFFLGPQVQHIEVLRIGVESEPQLPAYTTLTATPDPNHVCATPQLTAMPDP